MLRFVEASDELRKIVAEFMEWLVNEQPSWTAYRALITSRLLGLDKFPGV